MKDVRITAVAKVRHDELIERYELPLEEECTVAVGDSFVSRGGKRPEGLCDGAWQAMEPFVRSLAAGGGKFYGDWMRDPFSAMVSCNDGFRPVSFYIEVID